MDTEIAKQRILKTAVELFGKFGFRSISMLDISRHLGISKKTIYQYFADKDEIVTLAIQDHLCQEKELLGQIQHEAKDAVDLIIKVTNFLIKNIRGTRSSTIYDLRKYHEKAWAVVEEFRNDFLFKAVRENLSAGIAEGYFRPDIDVEILSRLRLEQVSMPLNQDLFPRSNFNLEQVSTCILDHFVAGVATDNGKKLYTKYKSQFENSLTSIL